MKRLLLIVGIVIGMNASAAVAQEHDNMPGHENMPPGEHAKHDKKKQRDAGKKKRGGAGKKESPKPDGEKHEGHNPP